MLPREWFTPRLAMRSPLLEDAEAILIGWAREPNVTRFLTWHPHEHLQRTNEFLELEKAGMSPRSPWTPACTSPTSATSLDVLALQQAPVWLAGGWGIDALIDRKTCAHMDL